MATKTAPKVDDLEAVEVILKKLADDQRPTYEDLKLLRSMNLSGEALENEVSRVKSVLYHQRGAGTGEERLATEETLSLVQQQLTDERPELEETIRAAQARLRELESTVAANERRLSVFEGHLARLREPQMLPEHVRTYHDSIMRDYGKHYRARIATLEQAIATAEIVAALKPDDLADRERAKMHLRGRFINDDATLRTFIADDGSLRAHQWSAYVSRLLDEVNGHRSELEQLKKEGQSLLDQAADALEHYVL